MEIELNVTHPCSSKACHHVLTKYNLLIHVKTKCTQYYTYNTVPQSLCHHSLLCVNIHPFVTSQVKSLVYNGADDTADIINAAQFVIALFPLSHIWLKFVLGFDVEKSVLCGHSLLPPWQLCLPLRLSLVVLQRCTW